MNQQASLSAPSASIEHGCAWETREYLEQNIPGGRWGIKVWSDNIRSSPRPIRKTWDEEKMKGLSWSWLEEGQVEPIGVSDNKEHYVVV